MIGSLFKKKTVNDQKYWVNMISDWEKEIYDQLDLPDFGDFWSPNSKADSFLNSLHKLNTVTKGTTFKNVAAAAAVDS